MISIQRPSTWVYYVNVGECRTNNKKGRKKKRRVKASTKYNASYIQIPSTSLMDVSTKSQMADTR